MTVPEAAIKAAAQAMTDDWNPDRDPVLTAMFSDYSATALAAATPHLRAAWEQPIRELHRPVEIEPSDTVCRECSFQLPNGHFFGKVVDWPCPTIALLEGGGE